MLDIASEIVWVLAATGIPYGEIISGIVAIAMAWIAFQQMKVKIKLDDQAKDLKEVKTVTQASYIFANHTLGEQKHLTAIALRSMAGVNPTAANVAAAEGAEKIYEDHLDGQAKVDANTLIQEALERAKGLLDTAKVDAIQLLKSTAEDNKLADKMANKVADKVVDKVADKVAENMEAKVKDEKHIPVAKAAEHMKVTTQGEKDTATVIQALAGEISKTHDIKGTVELTPKEPEKKEE